MLTVASWLSAPCLGADISTPPRSPASAATASGGRSSANDPILKEYLKQYPAADNDKDGVLGAWEYEAHLPPEFFKNIKGLRHNLMLPMRDGVRLATELFLPDGEGKRPTILIRTGYGRLTVAGYATSWIQKGCAVVTQDPRGDGASEGGQAVRATNAFAHEIPDTHDTVEWISKQPWSNGRVGTVGGSGHGMPATLGAWNGHPAFIYSNTTNSVGHWMRWQFHNGVRRWSYKWLGSFSRTVEETTPTTMPWDWAPWIAQIREYASKQDFVYVMGTGWYDPFLESALETFQALQDSGRAFVTIAARGHGGISGLAPVERRSKHPEHNTGLKPPDLLTCLRDGLPARGQSALRYYLMGDVRNPQAPGNVWRVTHVWPPRSQPSVWFLSAEGGISIEAPDAAGTQTFRYDPNTPAPSLGGHYEWSGAASGPHDQRPLLERSDVLLFSSKQLESPFIITGPMQASVVFSATVPDTAIIVKLIDIYPDGYHALVKETAGMARYHAGWSKPGTPIEPGRKYTLSLDFGSTAYAFATGHRLAVLFTGSSSPAYQIHPNRFEPVASLEGAPVAATSIHCGPGETALTLPQVDDDGY